MHTGGGWVSPRPPSCEPRPLLQSEDEVVAAFMQWLREEACQPHRDIPLTNHLVVPLVLVAGGSPLWAGLGVELGDGVYHLHPPPVRLRPSSMSSCPGLQVCPLTFPATVLPRLTK